MNAGVRQAVLQRLEGLRERLRTTYGVAVGEVQLLSDVELLLQCCETGVGADLYLSMSRQALEAVGAPRVTYLGTLDRGA